MKKIRNVERYPGVKLPRRWGFHPEAFTAAWVAIDDIVSISDATDVQLNELIRRCVQTASRGKDVTPLGILQACRSVIQQGVSIERVLEEGLTWPTTNTVPDTESRLGTKLAL